MAKITTTFTIIDRASSVFSRITGSANTLNTRFEVINTSLAQQSTAMDDATKKADALSKSANNLVRKLVGLSSAIAIVGNVANFVSIQLGRINALVKEYEDAVQAETMLTTVMKQRMNATDDMVQSILDMANAMEKVGIYEADAILMGAQELATYVTNKKALEALIPAMTDLVAQRNGFTVTSQDFVSAATMMGKVMMGQTSALSRVGYIFTEDEKRMLEMGNEMERASTLARLLTSNVGPMAESLASVDIGAIMNASNRINAVKESLGELFASMKQQFTLFRALIYERFATPILTSLENLDINLNKVVKTAATLVEVLMLVAAAYATVNAVKHPIFTLVVTGILLIIKSLRELGIEVGSFMGVLGGVLGAIAGIFTSVFKLIYNAVAAIWNVVAGLGEGIFNLFADPLKGVANLVLEVVRIILTVLNLLGSAIDVIFGTNITDSLQGVINDLDAFKESIWGDTAHITARRMQMDNIQNTSAGMMAIAGYNAGSELFNMIDEAFQADGTPNDILKYFNSGTFTTEDVNGVALVDEMKELLARKALEEYIVRVNQVTPQMTIENINVSETVDVDSVVDTIATAYSDLVDSYSGVRPMRVY